MSIASLLAFRSSRLIVGLMALALVLAAASPAARHVALSAAGAGWGAADEGLPAKLETNGEQRAEKTAPDPLPSAGLAAAAARGGPPRGASFASPAALDAAPPARAWRRPSPTGPPSFG